MSNDRNHRRKLEKLSEAVPGIKRDPAVDKELQRSMIELRRNRPDMVTDDDDGQGFTVHGIDGYPELHVRIEGVQLEALR